MSTAMSLAKTIQRIFVWKKILVLIDWFQKIVIFFFTVILAISAVLLQGSKGAEIIDDFLSKKETYLSKSEQEIHNEWVIRLEYADSKSEAMRIKTEFIDILKDNHVDEKFFAFLDVLKKCKTEKKCIDNNLKDEDKYEKEFRGKVVKWTP